MDALTLLTCESEDEGKGKDMRKKQRMDEAGDAIVPNSNECEFCKKECTGFWNESYVIWRRTCCLGADCAPSGSSSVGPAWDATTSVPPPYIIQHMLQKRLLNPDMDVIEAVPCQFGPSGWAVDCGGHREVLTADGQSVVRLEVTADGQWTVASNIVFEENKSKTLGLDKGDGDDVA